MREKRRRARGQGPRLRPENGPGGNQLPNTPCSRASVPKGHLEIARRFNAGLWSLDILHANGVPAHQPRATPWETGLQWQNPPCKGGGSFRGLRPFRAPERSEGPSFPGCYPGLICWRAFRACSCENRIETGMSKLQNPALKRRAILGCPSGTDCRGERCANTDFYPHEPRNRQNG